MSFEAADQNYWKIEYDPEYPYVRADCDAIPYGSFSTEQSFYREIKLIWRNSISTRNSQRIEKEERTNVWIFQFNSIDCLYACLVCPLFLCISFACMFMSCTVPWLKIAFIFIVYIYSILRTLFFYKWWHFGCTHRSRHCIQKILRHFS